MNEEQSKSAFVLMPFSGDFLEIYKYLIVESLESANFKINRADENLSQANILSDIVGGIISSDLIVADLTGSNANVYYELGVAHALNKKVILITQDIEELPFDLRSYRVISYGSHFSEMNRAKSELTEFAKEAYKGSLPFGNPVSDFGGVNNVSNLSNNMISTSGEVETDEDFGLFDYLVKLEEGMEQLASSVNEVGEKLNNELTPKITEAAEKSNSGKLRAREKRDVAKELGGHLEGYGAFLKPINDRYRFVLKEIETSLEQILSGEFEIESEESEESLNSFLKVLEDMGNSAGEARNGFVSMVAAMEAIPRIEKNFNRARTFMGNELKVFIGNIDQTISVTSRIVRLGKGLIEREHNKRLNADL